MTGQTILKLHSIQNRASSILAVDKKISDVATHEAAHFVAALSRDVFVQTVWVKGKYGSGQSIRTGGSDGHVGVLPYEVADDVLVAYAGHAWEEIHGDIGYAANDFQYAERAKLPEELDKARKLIQEHEQFIRQVAAAIIELRDSRGWLKSKKLQDLCSWVQFQQRMVTISHKVS